MKPGRLLRTQQGQGGIARRGRTKRTRGREGTSGICAQDIVMLSPLSSASTYAKHGIRLFLWNRHTAFRAMPPVFYNLSKKSRSLQRGSRSGPLCGPPSKNRTPHCNTFFLSCVVLAGLFHSIYGTEGYQGFKLPFTSRWGGIQD